MLNVEICAREEKTIFFLSLFYYTQSFEHKFVLYLLLCVYSLWTTTVKKHGFVKYKLNLYNGVRI